MSWINEAAVPNHNGNGFAHITDPSAVAGVMMDPSSFMGNPAQFNPQYANPQQIAISNGPIRGASPAFANTMYQTNSVIPSKRARPREDSIGQSPRQAPGMLPTSRAETPQQTFPGFQQPGLPSQQSGQPSPYPHLQANGSANATPSPIMSNQMRPNVPQRVSTSSPHPHQFSPATQQFPQTSPIPSEHGGTPQPFIPPNNFPQGFNQQFPPAQSPARPSPTPNPMAGMMPQGMHMQGQMPPQMSPMPGGQMAPMPSQMAGHMPQNMMIAQQMGQQPRNMEQQKLMYQIQLQQQAQAQRNMQMGQQGMIPMQGNPNNPQAQAYAQAQAQAQQRSMMQRQGMPNGQMPPGAMRPQPGVPQQQVMNRMGSEQFIKTLQSFMQSKGLPLDMNPIVEGRPIPLYNLFSVVSYKFGGYRFVTQSNGWGQVSQLLQMPPQQFPSAPPQLRAIYERNLLKYEDMWTTQQKMRMQQGGNPQHMMPGTPTKGMPQGQMMHPGQQAQFQQGQMQSPVKPQGPPQMGLNGYPGMHTPQHQRNSLSRSIQATPTADEFSLQSPSVGKAGSISLPGSAHPENQGMPDEMTATVKFPGPFAGNPDEYMPSSREHTSFGGLDSNLVKIGEELQKAKIDLPLAIELGNVDIHALTKSIQSGIHGEVRVALDHLALISSSDAHYFTPTQGIPVPQVDLRYCYELLEALIDCAEEQVDQLAENSEEASNDLLFSPYEDVMRACQIDRLALRNVSAPGSLGHDLDRAVDRLICITTILRNFSWQEHNHKALADEMVIDFLCVVIRYIGTREMLLRTHANTLDLMKDLVTLLSNIAGSVVISGREQAFCLLQFLLAFAPAPGPTKANGKLLFASYNPPLHPYLPHAVDSLAKLLARDEPNRKYYRALFVSDAAVNASPPCELLTKTFALAISPIPPVPDVSVDTRHAKLPPLVEARKPFLMQGLLAADILAGLAPNFESGVARSWLCSATGFTQNLLSLVPHLSKQYEEQVFRSRGPHPHVQGKRDAELVYISTMAVNLLRRLSEKARDPNNPVGDHGIPPEALPSKGLLLSALQLRAQEWGKDGMLADLVAYASLGE
ncbi:SWI/SNF chromatin-remodeling complex subunit sol1 [Cladorrhinum sp. PSN332]|nr:SWI/SNF chromatin-remodeling complex subunit sol1 [Cladorrhinum sp. PSN332]